MGYLLKISRPLFSDFFENKLIFHLFDLGCDLPDQGGRRGGGGGGGDLETGGG